MQIKKYAVIIAILFTWIAMTAFALTLCNLATDIINETCVPWGVYSSISLEKVLSSINILISYLLPLMCMVVCYSRIVYVLRNKVIGYLSIIII